MSAQSRDSDAPARLLTEALAHMATLQASVAQAPPGHNPLACEALGEAEDSIVDAAAGLPESTCPTCAAVRAMGNASQVLSVTGPGLDDETWAEVHEATGGLLWGIRGLWAEHVGRPS